MTILTIYALALAGISLAAFVLYGVDKQKAIRHLRRIPEKTLLALGLCGGAVGALAGMLVFHHKTRKGYFWAVNILGLAVQLAILYLLFHKIQIGGLL